MKITIKGRKIPLSYTVWGLKQIWEAIGSPTQAIEKALGRNPEDEKDTSRLFGVEQLETVAKLIRIMGNEGLEEAGEDADLTDEWIMKAMKPVELANYISLIMDALNEGMMSEIPEEKPQGPVDVTLEEIKRKKGRAG